MTHSCSPEEGGCQQSWRWGGHLPEGDGPIRPPDLKEGQCCLQWTSRGGLNGSAQRLMQFCTSTKPRRCLRFRCSVI